MKGGNGQGGGEEAERSGGLLKVKIEGMELCSCKIDKLNLT